MNRRELLRNAGRAAAAAALWAAVGPRGWAALPAASGWSPDDEALLDAIGDTILPATPGSPGAAAVAIGRFMVVMVTDCHPPAAAAALRRGLEEITAEARRRHGRGFRELATADREALLLAYESGAFGAKGGSPAPFRLLKELTLLGYFTSEAGATQALRYLPVPGAYRGSVPLAPGDRSWAT